jgi:hypothetical protein
MKLLRRILPRRLVCRNDTSHETGPLRVRLRSGLWTLDEGRTSWGQEDAGAWGVNAWWTRDPSSSEGRGEINATWTASAPPTREELARGIHRVRLRLVRVAAPVDLASFEIGPDYVARWQMPGVQLAVTAPPFRSWASVPDRHLAEPTHRLAWTRMEGRRLAAAAPVPESGHASGRTP